MRYLDFVLICAVFAGCQGNPAAVPMTADTPVGLFSIIEPLADADPSIRHVVEVNVPTIMRVVSRGNSVTVSFPTLVPMNLTVGDRMETGIRYKQTLHLDGVERFLSRSLHGGLAFNPGDPDSGSGRSSRAGARVHPRAASHDVRDRHSDTAHVVTKDGEALPRPVDTDIPSNHQVKTAPAE